MLFERDALERDIRWKNLTALTKRKRRWDERERRWVMREQKRVWVDVNKLDAALRLRPSDYVGPAGKNGISGKYDGVDQFVRSQKDALYMPTAGIHRPEGDAAQKIVYILDGRHRFAWMRDHGALALPVSVAADEAFDIAKLVGTRSRICRVSMWYIPELAA